MYKIIAIIGASGSGKNAVLDKVLNKDRGRNMLHKIIQFTTRDKRLTETNGKEYYFISPEEFAEKVVKNEMLEAAIFNGWAYGTGKEGLSEYKINIGIFNPAAIECLLGNKELDVTVFYLKADDRIRLLRQLNRPGVDVDEVIRRLKTDREDFYDIDDLHPITIENGENANLNKIGTQIYKEIL